MRIWLHYGLCGDDPNWYPTVEHAYQASKFPADRRQMFDWKTLSATDAKHIGRGQGSEEWRTKNIDIMHHLLREKFKEPYLKTLLLRTGDAILEEGNLWHDNFWGRCLCLNCQTNIKIQHNHLGRLLALVRWELQHPEIFNASTSL